MKETSAFNLLLVDDDPLVHQSLKLIIPKEWKIFSIQNIDYLSFDRFYHAAFIDMHLKPGVKAQGPKIISELLHKHPQTEAVAISGDLSRELMETCLKAGAQRFLPKPLMPDEILMTLEKIEALWNLRTQKDRKSHSIQWIGESTASNELRRKLAQLNGENGCILIQGETGTGKDVIANLLNQQESSRPFISVNMAAIPENIFESEMFGHTKGAFTGADANKIGLLEAANGGDLFLDEIEALPLTQQAKLLRFLENGEIRKVGGKEIHKIQTRVISASNRPLREMVAAGEFREDLYFRLCTHLIEIPPLRERYEDIAPLARYFLENGKPKRNKQFSDDGFDCLKKYSWPGNVRELKRVCEQLSLTSPLPLIREEDVAPLLFSRIIKSDSIKTNSFEASQSKTTYPKPDLSKGLNQALEEFESELIRECIKEHKDIEKAAQHLQISRSSLYKKIKDLKIEENK